MQFLISTNIVAFRAVVGQDRHIIFQEPGDNLSTLLTDTRQVDVWIARGPEVTNVLLQTWIDHASRETTKILFVEDAEAETRLRPYAKDRIAIAAYPHHKQPGVSQEELLLREAELLYARQLQRSVTRPHLADKRTVLLVGAGITNLMTAEFLATRGFNVRIVDAGPDPRSTNDWTRLGITSGGGNARMFTHTEADNYNEKGDGLYSDMQGIFRKTARNGGWSVKAPATFAPAELRWVEEFEQLSPWLARAFKENILEVTREAGKLWNEYLSSTPELFEDVEYRKDIVRLYAEPKDVDAAVKLTSTLGTLLEAPNKTDFLAANSGFESAAATDHLAGGIKVQGFTVNIHPFVAKLIDRITSFGGEMLWDHPVHSIERNASGEVTALQSQHGRLQADHFVLSLGVTGNALLKGTRSEDLMQGVLGIWLQIPNLHPQVEHSIKIHRRGHLVEDINITVAKDSQTGENILQFGGGYGYVGLDWPAPGSPELAALFDELEEVARIYFPRGYAAARERGTLFPGGHRKFCVRPFTPTGLGVFETMSAASGGLVINTGGNNTGGFAQAPALAQAVHRALIGEYDHVHVLYHPSRGRLPAPIEAVNIQRTSVPQQIAITEHDTTNQFQEPLRVRSSAKLAEPLKLLLLCSDGPQHRYLRYLFDKAFPGYRCIVEPGAGQLRQLQNKGRTTEARWQKYHGIRRRFLGYDARRKQYFDRLVPQDHVFTDPDLIVDSLNTSKVWTAVEEWQPELTIVSGTKYIGKKLNERAGLMVNLHTGHLPEYKGNHCIFFALRDGALQKVASTLHQLTPHLDGGHVLDIVYPEILPSDDEEALYTKCVRAAMEKSLEHAERFARGQRLEFVAQQDAGQLFRHRDRTPSKEIALWWKVKVGGLVRDGTRRWSLNSKNKEETLHVEVEK